MASIRKPGWPTCSRGLQPIPRTDLMNCSRGIGSRKPRSSPLRQPEKRTYKRRASKTETHPGRLRSSPHGYPSSSVYGDPSNMKKYLRAYGNVQKHVHPLGAISDFTTATARIHRLTNPNLNWADPSEAFRAKRPNKRFARFEGSRYQP